MTDTKARAPRVAREYGMIADVRLFVPVDKKDLKAQIRVSEAVDKAVSDGDASALFSIPGVRVVSTAARFDAFKAPAQAAAAPVADEGQGDIEEAIAEAGDGAGEAEATEDAPAEEEPTGGRRSRRAA